MNVRFIRVFYTIVMLSEIKLVVSENNKIIETVIRETGTQPIQLLKSLEEFQRTANSILTNMIESHGDSGGDIDIVDEDDCEDDGEDLPIGPKKRKK